jgi:hypothetical protein
MPKKDRHRITDVIMAVRTGDADISVGERKKAAQMLGQRGGKARAKVLSAERRKEIAHKGAAARWKT